MSHLLTPMVRDLVSGADLSEQRWDEIKTFMAVAPRLDVKALKIWDKQGRIIYSSRREAIGQTYEPDDHLIRASRARSRLSWTSHRQKVQPSSTLGNLLEVYVPVYSADGGTIRNLLQEALLLHDREAFAEHDGELRLRVEPFPRRPFPVVVGAVQDEI